MKLFKAFPVAILLLFAACSTSYHSEVSSSLFYKPGKGNSAGEDASLDSMIVPYRNKLNAQMSEVLIESVSPIDKGQPESRLGNFVADACFETALEIYKADDGAMPDFCVLNNGGLRSMLPKGPVTRKHVFELMPFENELVILTMDGKDVRSLLEYIVSKGGVPVSNLKMSLSADVATATIGGVLFNESQKYKVVTSDYLANGGDAMYIFAKNIRTELLQLKVRDAIIRCMENKNKKNLMLNPVADGRISK
jgi:2',3'-cyclic-nucleotide 2'-phosphodiesterase (5'-nucleotidase family)